MPEISSNGRPAPWRPTRRRRPATFTNAVFTVNVGRARAVEDVGQTVRHAVGKRGSALLQERRDALRRVAGDPPRGDRARVVAVRGHRVGLAGHLPQQPARQRHGDGAVFSTISRAIERAAGSSAPGVWTLRTRPARRASSATTSLPVATHSIAVPMPTMRGRNQLEAPFGHDAAADVDEAELAVGRAQADVHRQRHRGPDADRGPVDRPDHGLERVEDAQRDHAAAVARTPSAVGGRREAAAAEVRAGAERLARARHDDRADVVVGVRGVERVQELLEHPVGQRVELAPAG